MMFDLIPFENRNSSLFDYFNRMNRDFFGDMEKELTPCRTDILDKGDKFILRADMPGFDKSDIHIDVDGERLTLTAEHSEETKDDSKDYIRQERRYGALTRSFDISNIDADKIKASYEKGVLELELPKKANVVPPTRQIEIK
ncbi:MAG TPA: Hsp20/alpha crystallin family protein [Caproiciproducens sp.]|jgi:Molecular chaperone (small heat shock protein)|nr:Hsp20/alpha crystallin family protein [Caproiciproducens sp.]